MDFSQTSTLQMVIQGGAVGLCALTIVVLWRVIKLNNKTINNHLDHIEKSNLKRAESDEKMAESHENLAVAIQDLKGVIRGCPNNKLNI